MTNFRVLICITLGMHIEYNASKNMWSPYATGLVLLLFQFYNLDTNIAGAEAESDQQDGAKD